VEGEQGPGGVRADGHLEAVHARGVVVAVGEAEAALVGERPGEPDGGAGGSRALEPVFGRAIGVELDVLAGLQQGMRGEEAGLPGTDHGDLAHDRHLHKARRSLSRHRGDCDVIEGGNRRRRTRSFRSDGLC
jgi:hypothetical protein